MGSSQGCEQEGEGVQGVAFWQQAGPFVLGLGMGGGGECSHLSTWKAPPLDSLEMVRASDCMCQCVCV